MHQFQGQTGLRESENTNIPFPAALAGALRRCSSLVWPATRYSSRLALHPAITTKNGTFAISDSLKWRDLWGFIVIVGNGVLFSVPLHFKQQRLANLLPAS